jgi:hypothetical protein
MIERGVTEQEILLTVGEGEKFPAKFGRTGYRRNFHYGGHWRGRFFEHKQIEVYAAPEGSDWVVITVITRFF